MPSNQHSRAFFIETNNPTKTTTRKVKGDKMDFFNSAIEVLGTLTIALGGGLGVWGLVNMLEGYGNDNAGSKSQGVKQLMAGAGIALIGVILIPLLADLF